MQATDPRVGDFLVIVISLTYNGGVSRGSMRNALNNLRVLVRYQQVHPKTSGTRLLLPLLTPREQATFGRNSIGT